MSLPSILMLPELIAALPGEMRTLCDRLMFVERAHGTLVPPPAMHAWITRYFGDLERVREQTVVKVMNRLTLETAFYSPLRAYRPQESETSAKHTADPDQILDTLIAAKTGPHDMFRAPLNQTPADVFGRIRGKHCVSASNVAKCDGWHGLVIFDEPHPLRFNQAQIRDYFDVALRWLVAAHRVDPAARYPLIAWNGLWKGGASITHGHMQMILSRGMACGHVERWRRAADAYRTNHDGSLLCDLWHLHQALGLAFGKRDQAAGYVTLTPVKDRELVLFSRLPREAHDWGTMDSSGARAALEPLWDLTCAALRTLIDVEGVRCFNVAVYLPPCAPTDEAWNELPVCVRIVDRGNPLSRTVSIGAMELFASSIITVDPFPVAAALRLS